MVKDILSLFDLLWKFEILFYFCILITSKWNWFAFEKNFKWSFEFFILFEENQRNSRIPLIRISLRNRLKIACLIALEFWVKS